MDQEIIFFFKYVTFRLQSSYKQMFLNLTLVIKNNIFTFVISVLKHMRVYLEFHGYQFIVYRINDITNIGSPFELKMININRSIFYTGFQKNHLNINND